MIKKMYAVVSQARNLMDETIDTYIDGFDAQVFASKEDAVRRIIENMRKDLLGLEVGEKVVEHIMEQHQKGNYIHPSRIETIVFPFGGGDRGAIETYTRGFYYRIREVVLEMPNTPVA